MRYNLSISVNVTGTYTTTLAHETLELRDLTFTQVCELVGAIIVMKREIEAEKGT